MGSPERIKIVAERIIKKKKEGNRVLVVVSAMGDTTDELVDLSQQIDPDNPPVREMDMLLTTGEQISMSLLSMAIQKKGHAAVSYTGWQSGIMTEPFHGKARIANIEPKRLNQALEAQQIVVVAGFQGMSEDGEITTLGRGGSDTTAVALAAAVEADYCEIYTDVDGVYSTDPRIVRNARKLKEISYDEMLELANLGTAILHPRAVEYAKQYNVQLIVRSSFTDNEGTIVKEEAVMEQGIVVRGIAYDKNVARISILGLKEQPGQLARVFTALGNEKINVDIIVQSGVMEGVADVSFSVDLSEMNRALAVLERIKTEIGYREVTSETNLAKVSIVGAGMVSNSGVAAKMFEVISGQGVTISMVSTSEIKVSCVIQREHLNEVVRSLHTAYDLDTTDEVFVGGPAERR